MEKTPKNTDGAAGAEWKMLSAEETDIQPSDSTEPANFDTDANNNVVKEAAENSKERYVFPDGTIFYGTPKEYNEAVKEYLKDNQA